MRDAEHGSALATLMAAAQQQADLVDADIARLWDNFFAETCDPWVLAYIADLIGLNLISDQDSNNRREVARTIAYRRRKGTVSQLETMAADITGWHVRVQEFFQNLLWTQNMIHFRPGDLWTIDLRDRPHLRRLGGAFECASHTADLRPSTLEQGNYQIRKLGFNCFRLQPIPLVKVRTRPASGAPAGCYHFSALDRPEPLFLSPPPLARKAGDPWPRVQELDVRQPIRRYQLNESLQATPANALQIEVTVNGAAISHFESANLCDWSYSPVADVAIDPELGRLKFKVAPANSDAVRVTYNLGLSAPIGGGAYDRSTSMFPSPGETDFHVFHVAKSGAPYSTIQQALNAAGASTASEWIVQIDDSEQYVEPFTLPASFPSLVIQAANGQRPKITLQAAPVAAVAGFSLVFSGLLITGLGQTLTVPDGVGEVHFLDCTVDPGGGLSSDGAGIRPAGVQIVMSPKSDQARLVLERTIFGTLSLPPGLECCVIRDSIGDASAFAAPLLPAGPKLLLERSTLIGDINVDRLEASLAICTGTVTITHQQEGCVRFCYFGANSQTPRRYKCAPSLPIPLFTSMMFGNPAYMQLSEPCQDAIRWGEQGNEMGAWSSLGNQKRLRHLQIRLQEYMPAGMVPQILFRT